MTGPRPLIAVGALARYQHSGHPNHAARFYLRLRRQRDFAPPALPYQSVPAAASR
jgi:hypothetical protein